MRLLRFATAAMVALLAACASTGAGQPTLAPSARVDPELWVTLQGTSRLMILHGAHADGPREAVDLAAGTGPHITTFSPSGKFAYVSGMGNGDLNVVSTAPDHKVIRTLHLGTVGTHQAKPSPNGSFLLAAQVGSQSLIKIRADEVTAAWNPAGSLSFAAANKAPICSIFRDDGNRAYVSLFPTGLAIVDVTTMGLVATLPVEGFIACGMVKSKDGKTVTMASSGGGGHIYRLDAGTEKLSDLGALGAADWHSFNMSADEKMGFGSEPMADELRIIDLHGDRASTLAAISLDATPGAANDQPDAIAVRGDTVFVSLRASGKLAVIDIRRRTATYLDIAPASSFNPGNCAGCAIHGVTVRS